MLKCFADECSRQTGSLVDNGNIIFAHGGQACRQLSEANSNSDEMPLVVPPVTLLVSPIPEFPEISEPRT
jgi:hypothetical protein